MKGMELLYIISIVAIIHGLFLAGLLFSYRKGNTRANRILGLFMASFAAILSYTVVYDSPLVFVCFSFLFLLGPLFHFYVKLLTRPGIAMKKRDLAHFAPFGLVFAFMLFCAAGGYYNDISGREPGYNPVTIIYWSIILVFVQVHIALYLFFSWRLIRAHRRRIADYFSTVDIINLSWLKYFMGALVLVLMLAIVLTIILPGMGFRERECDMAASLFISLFMFAMGYRGLLQPEIFTGTAEVPDAEAGGKYRRSSINSDEADRYIREIRGLMAGEELYTDPDLTLDDIAGRISVSRHLLSQILNEVMRTNFYDFISGYRIEKIKSDLRDETKAGRSILDLAFDAGFNSKSTFNAAFKRQTGMTPSQFRSVRQSG
jgi:AraC-like DNA-binding protein